MNIRSNYLNPDIHIRQSLKMQTSALLQNFKILLYQQADELVRNELVSSEFN
jgi:hypothetical protein